jgi:hypothetical protein
MPPDVILDEKRKSTESDVYSFACTCMLDIHLADVVVNFMTPT